MALNNSSPLDVYAKAIQVWLNEGKSKTEIVGLLLTEFGVTTSRDSVRRCIERHGLSEPDTASGEKVKTPGSEQPGFSVSGDEAWIITDVDVDLGDFDRLLKDRGLNPEEWAVERVLVNEWQAYAGRDEDNEPEIVTLKQNKIFLKRKTALQLITPAVHIPVIAAPKPRITSDSYLVVIVGDEQEPYSDPLLKVLFRMWLAENQPYRGIHLGDLMDFPTISRHKDNPEWAAPVQDCINAGYMTLRHYREASVDTEWDLLVGNHDERLRNELLQRAERMYGIRPADVPGEKPLTEALSVQNLLHLDDLNINFVNPRGGYAHAQVKLSDELGVRHGWLVGDNTAQKSLDRLGHSVIVGHTHHQRAHYKTVYDIDGNSRVLTALEAGTMASMRDGLGYAINPDWQQGFATAQIWDDGSYHLDLATFSGGVLRWRDQRFEL